MQKAAENCHSSNLLLTKLCVNQHNQKEGAHGFVTGEVMTTPGLDD